MCECDIKPAALNRRTRRVSLAKRTADAIGRHIGEVLDNELVASRDGLLQRVEPRGKLLSLLLYTVTVSLVRSPWMLAGLVALTLALATASKVGAASFARKVWATAGLFASLVAAPAMTQAITPGRVVVALGVLSLTQPGILGALTLVLRVVASAGFALLIVWTMRWTDLLGALTALKVPDIIVATLAMTQKQIVSLMRTVQQMHLARESRTLSTGTTAQDRDWVTGRMAFVVSKSIKTADDVYDAMLARGFDGHVRVLRASRRSRINGWVWLLVTVTACCAVLALDRVMMPR